MHLPRFRSAYFAFFFYLGTFAPYWTAYLKEALGFSEDAAGRVYGTLIISGIVGGLAVTRLADLWRRRLRLQRILSLAAAGACALWLMVETEAQAYALAVLHGLLIMGQIPMLDAALIDHLGAARQRYGRQRLYGTLGFAAAVAIVGQLRGIDQRNVLLTLSGALLVYHATTWLLPDSQTRAEAGGRSRGSVLHLLRRGPVFALLASTFLHGTAFAAYEVFAVIHYDALGFGSGQITAAYLAAMGCETVFLFTAPRLLSVRQPRNLAAFALGATCLRWLGMASFSDPLVLIPLQLLHGLSFGLWYAAGIHFLGTLVPPELRTSGQGLFSIAMTCGFGVGGLLSGAVRAGFGGQTSFLVAAAIGLGALLLLLSIRGGPQARKPSHPDLSAA